MSIQTHRAVVPTWQAVLNLILLAAAFVCSLLYMKGSVTSVYGNLAALTGIVTILCGAYYCFSGYKKNGRLFFKMFAYAYALSHIFGVMFLVEYALVPVVAGIRLVSFGAVCSLATGLDLGKNRSYTAAALVLFCQLLCLILTILSPGYNLMASVLGPVSDCLIAVLLCFIVYAKYRDKEHRHTT